MKENCLRWVVQRRGDGELVREIESWHLEDFKKKARKIKDNLEGKCRKVHEGFRFTG